MVTKTDDLGTFGLKEGDVQALAQEGHVTLNRPFFSSTNRQVVIDDVTAPGLSRFYRVLLRTP